MAPKKATKEAEKPKVSPEILEKQKELKKREKELPKVSKPERSEYDAEMEEVNNKIGEFNDKIKKLNDKIGERSTGREEFNKKKDEIRQKLDECSAEIDRLEKERSTTQGSIKEKQEQGRNARQQLNDMKKKLGYENAAEIDTKIRELEYEMMTESLTLKKEKEIMQKISQLKASKPLVGKYAAMESTVGTDGSVAPMKAKMGDVMEQLKEARENKKAAQAAYTKLIESRQKQIGDMPELFEQREALNKQVREQIEIRNAKRDEFNKANREFQAYQAELREIRNEKYKLERAEKQAEWESRKQLEKADETPEIPFVAEITYIETTTKYLKALKPKEAKTEEKAAPEAIKADGMTVLVGKANREEEFFYAPTKSKKLKAKGQGAKKGKPITHDMETLLFFDKFNIPVPMLTTDIDDCLVKLDEKMAEYKKKQEDAIEKAKNPPKEEEAVAEEAA